MRGRRYHAQSHTPRRSLSSRSLGPCPDIVDFIPPRHIIGKRFPVEEHKRYAGFTALLDYHTGGCPVDRIDDDCLCTILYEL